MLSYYLLLKLKATDRWDAVQQVRMYERLLLLYLTRFLVDERHEVRHPQPRARVCASTHT